MSEKKKRILQFLEKSFVYSLFAIAIGGGLVYGLLLREVASGKQLALLANYKPSTPTRLYDRNGRVFAELYLHKQNLIPFQAIPPHVVQAFLSIEDDNFYNHYGIDYNGILRAAIKNLLAGSIVQGGSTLTQQLAKQIYLSTEKKRDRTILQKIREMILALQMEEVLSKNEILEVYFNVIYLGHGCQGLACAAKLYFSKKVEDLTIAEGALLARLPKSPVEYSPFRDPRAAKEQHRAVLKRMAENGFIAESQIEPIHNQFWNSYWGKVIVQSPSQNIWADKLDLAPFFTDYVRQILESSEEIGPEMLYTRGLRVYTTLDLDQQTIATEEMGKALEKSNKIGRNYAMAEGKSGVSLELFDLFNTLSLLLPIGKPDIQLLDEKSKMRKALQDDGLLNAAQMLTFSVPATNESIAFQELRRDTVSYLTNLEVQGAFVAIEPRTGYITAMIGGAEYSPKNQFNRALMARRQPGSAFKVFVYGAAFEERAIGTMSTLNDAPFFAISKDGGIWSPGNYEEGFRGLVPAITAMALSLNTCSVQVYYKVGAAPIIDLASRLLKISSPNRFNSDPALALGTSEVTPMELATAMAIIDNDGRDVIPFPIRYVTDQAGNVIYSQEAKIRKALSIKAHENKIQIIDPALAYLIREMMMAVANRGTASRGIRSPDYGNFPGDVAAKTGTTSSWSDAWVTGFNPDIASVVWFGFDKSSITLGPGQAGGSLAAPVLGHFLRRYYRSTGYPIPAFENKHRPPAGVIATNCGGLGLAPIQQDGRYKAIEADEICASEEHKIYDQRELLMKEFGITKEELGVDKGSNLHFKKEE